MTAPGWLAVVLGVLELACLVWCVVLVGRFGLRGVWNLWKAALIRVNGWILDGWRRRQELVDDLVPLDVTSDLDELLAEEAKRQGKLSGPDLEEELVRSRRTVRMYQDLLARVAAERTELRKMIEEPSEAKILATFGDVEVVEFRAWGDREPVRRVIRPVLPEPPAGYDLEHVSAALNLIDALNEEAGR